MQKIHSSLPKRNYCPCCGSSKIHFFQKNNSKKLKYIFVVETYICSECKFYFQNPLFDYETIKVIYQEGYVGDELAQQKRFEREYINRKSSALSFVDLIKDGDSILEIGCSSGYNLKNIADNFKGKLKLKGVDYDINSVKYGKEKYGLDLSNEDAFELNEKFNFVYLNHVFEHVENIEDYLKKLTTLLKKDGYLIINVPNSQMWKEAPIWEHINYFNEKSVRLLATKLDGYNFVTSTNTIHSERHNVPEVRLIVSKNELEARKSDEYKMDIKTLRRMYDSSSSRIVRKELSKISRSTEQTFLNNIFWSKLYVAFTFKWLKSK